MVATAGEPFQALYEQFRNRFRPFQPHSIVRAAMATLREPAADSLEHLRRLPWQLMLIVKWVLQDAMCSDMSGRPITGPEFDELRQQLHAFPDRMAGLGTGSFQLSMRRLLHQQLAFQQRMSTSFAREAALLGTLAADHPLREMFQQRTGLIAEDFLDFAFATYTAILDDKLTFSLTWFRDLQAAYGADTLKRFTILVSRDYEELRAFCRSLPGNTTRVTSEFFEFTPIKRFPFLRTGETLECWDPMVFFRGMEGLVHSVLSEAGSSYIEPFSKVFEQHIRSELRSVGNPMLEESDLRGLVGQGTQVPDALLSFPGANVFVEAKAGIFDESVLVAGEANILSHKTRALRTAIAQGWAAASAIRRNESAPKQVREAPIDYLLIVTNRELNSSKGTMLEGMYPDGKLRYPSEDAERFLPLNRVYVLSADDFERMIAAARIDGLDVPKLLADCVESDSKPGTAKFLFEQHLTSFRVRLGRSTLVEKALDGATERLTRALTRA